MLGPTFCSRIPIFSSGVIEEGDSREIGVVGAEVILVLLLHGLTGNLNRRGISRSFPIFVLSLNRLITAGLETYCFLLTGETLGDNVVLLQAPILLWGY